MTRVRDPRPTARPSSGSAAATWRHADLTALTGAPGGFEPRPYVRGDGVAAIVYQSSEVFARIRELALEGGRWRHYDLSAAAGGAPAGYLPRPYVRGDGVSAVLYQDADTGGRIRELTLVGGAWRHGDLMAVAQAPAANANGSARGYVRKDGVTAVVYQGGSNRVQELTLVGGTWRHHDLMAAAQAPGGPDDRSLGELAAYVRKDGVSAVVYRTWTGALRELTLVGGQWKHHHLGQAAGAPAADPPNLGPMGAYVRKDGVSAVVYVGESGRVHELTLTGGQWKHWDLTAAAGGAPAAASGVSAYVRGDGVSAVVYRGTDGHTHELTLEGGRWRHWDLTQVTGAPPGTAGVEQSGYVRKDGVSAVVYKSDDEHIHELALQ